MKRGVTSIEDLFDLDQEERDSRDNEISKLRTKSIRNTGQQGGMRNYEKLYNQQHQQPIISVAPIYQEEKQPILIEEIEPDVKYQKQLDYLQLSCIDVCNHANKCPVCSRIYNNNDTSIFIAVIVVLVIICIILLKRVMEMK